jgi:uncharacterized Fe-S center protein
MDCVKCDFCGRIWEAKGFGNGPHMVKGEYLDICNDCLKVVKKSIKEVMDIQWEKYHRRKHN